MNRITDQRQAEAIAEAFEIIPAAIGERLARVHFFTGIDPIWAGVHNFQTTDDGRSYRETACCCYPFHSLDRSTTIVLPTFQPPRVIVHELGHALHWTLGFRHSAEPVTKYADTNQWEAFAESFTTHLLWGYGDEDAYMRDEPSRRLFADLAA